jgi:hypothetical protein
MKSHCLAQGLLRERFGLAPAAGGFGQGCSFTAGQGGSSAIPQASGISLAALQQLEQAGFWRGDGGGQGGAHLAEAEEGAGEMEAQFQIDSIGGKSIHLSQESRPSSAGGGVLVGVHQEGDSA